MENTYVVDLQFFRGNNKEIILKCISFSKLFSNTIEYFVFKAPFNISELCPYRRCEAQFVTKNFHHIQWDQGFIDYYEIGNTLRDTFKGAEEILVKGLEKAKFLNNILGRNVCYNVENLNCPNLKSLKSKLTGFPSENVSHLNVKVLKSWLKIIFLHDREYINTAINNFHECQDFSFLSGTDLYFIPISFLLKKYTPQFLRIYADRFPPHIALKECFQEYIALDSFDE